MKKLTTYLVILCLLFTTASALATDEVIELDFWNMQWGNEQYSTLEQELLDQYMEENPNIKINYTCLPWTNWYQTFASAIAAGIAPDVPADRGIRHSSSMMLARFFR